MIRKPVVAGSFYPADPEKLRAELKRCLPPATPSLTKAIGIVSPHAGYIYSGAVAGKLYRRIELPEKFVILSPNHTGRGKPFALMPEGEWETPLGCVSIDAELASQFMNHCPLLQVDAEAHILEHALEVQLPFLQFLRKEFSFVPLTLGPLSFAHCEAVGKALARTIHERKDPILVIASSDMNHYESQEIALKKDRWAIDKILSLDPKGLYRTVHDKNVSMCGIIPTTVMLVAAKELGAQKAELVQHATSGDVTGDYGSVVGYASLIVSQDNVNVSR